MALNANLEILIGDVDKAIYDYEDRRMHNRRWSTTVATTATCLTAATTALIGSASIWTSHSQIINTIAITVSALVTIVTGWENLFGRKKLWVLYTNAWINMRMLRNDLSHLSKSGADDQDEINKFYERYKEIVQDLNKKWNALRDEQRS